MSDKTKPSETPVDLTPEQVANEIMALLKRHGYTLEHVAIGRSGLVSPIEDFWTCATHQPSFKPVKLRPDSADK